MIRFVIAVIISIVAFIAATLSATFPYLMLLPLSLVVFPFLVFIFPEGEPTNSALLGFSYGVGVAMAAVIPAMLCNVRHPSWRSWLASNAILFFAVTLVGGLMRGTMRWADPVNMDNFLVKYPPVDSPQTTGLIVVTSVLAAGLWYGEQRRKGRRKMLIDIRVDSSSHPPSNKHPLEAETE